jgi:glycosyltransferase involved in cell wall biosynthesis
MNKASVKPRIGIFQAHLSLQFLTIDPAIALTQAGYQVDLFLYKTPDFYGIDQLGQIPNLRPILFSRPDEGLSAHWKLHDMSRPARALDRLRRGLGWRLAWPYHQYLLWRQSERSLLPSAVLQKTQELMKGAEYRCLIGVEKKGLLWAGRMASEFDIPFLYYSLELYTWEHPATRSYPQARRLKMAEERYHRKSSATIIQDPRRAEELLRDNGLQDATCLYVPVSQRGQPHRERSIFLQKRFELEQDQILILQFGGISEQRMSIRLAEIAQRFPDNWTLVYHGYGPARTIESIRATDVHHRIILSLERLSVAEIPEMISSAHIGLVLYRDSPVNDYLTAFSSAKLALCLQCGLPIIAFNYPGYDLLERRRCGVLIETLDDLPHAIEQVLFSYDELHANAFDCFLEHYEFSRNFRKVVNYIDSLP